MTKKTTQPRLPKAYILWGIAFIPTSALTACGTCALVAGINTLFPAGMLAAAAIGIAPVIAIAKAFFAWMDSVSHRPLASYLHTIGATCVLTEIFLILAACWCGETLDQNTPVVTGLFVVYLAAVITVSVCSLKYFANSARRELKTEEAMEAYRASRSDALREQAAKSLAEEEPEPTEPYEEPVQEYNCPPPQCYFGPSECTNCGGCH